LGAARNIRLYPWFKFFQNLTFWQAIWFLFFQGRLSAAEAVIFYAIYDIATTLLEVPSGYFSDRFGRRVTLILSGGFMVLAGVLLTLGDGFLAFAMAQGALGAGMAFASGTDTALLYESLTDTGRSDEVEAQEVRAWRFSFAALALSALSGGLASLIWERLPFLLSALAYGAMLLVILRLSEPSHRDGSAVPQGDEALRLGSLKRALLHPVLIWLFLLGVLMYGFSHLPFIFGQPFILQALETRGLEAAAPLVSAAIHIWSAIHPAGTGNKRPGNGRTTGQRRRYHGDDAGLCRGFLGCCAPAQPDRITCDPDIGLWHTGAAGGSPSRDGQLGRGCFPVSAHGAGRHVTPVHHGPHSAASE